MKLDARQYAEVLNAMPLGMVVFQLEDASDARSLRLCDWNPAAVENLGIDWPAFVGRTVLEMFPHMPPDWLEAYANVVRRNQAADIGEVPYGAGIFSIRAVPVGADRLAILFRNITGTKATEGELSRVTSFLDSIVENIPHMIFVKEAAELRFERINRAGEELLGLTRESLIGKNDYDFFPAAQAAFFQTHDRQTLSSGVVHDIPEEPIQTHRGERWLHTKKIPILDEAGTPLYLLGISEDVTDHRLTQKALDRAREELERRLRSSEEQLRQAQKMEAIGRLAGGVAHDFNNLLAVVLSYANLLLDELDAQSPLRGDLEEINKAGMRAAQLTRQLLAFSRQQVLTPRNLDLNDVIAGLHGMLNRLIGEDVECSIRTAPVLERIKVDPGQVEQVIMNLVVNARDSMPEGGKLTIETSNVELDEAYARAHDGVRAGKHVMLAISDTGSGMSPEIRSRIFEPFFTTKPRGRGTGLGLSTVFGIVKQSGAHISVYSEVGHGSTFKVYFPVSTARDELGVVSQAVSELGGGSETILLVEDEPLVRRAAREVLRKRGYSILEAAGPDEALAFCETFHGPIQLMLTDVVMPKMSGKQLSEKLALLRPEIKVLYMSGYTEDTIVHHGVLDPGIQYIQKPFTPESLARKVRQVLDSD